MTHGWLKKRCLALLLLASPISVMSAQLSVLLPEQSVRLDYPKPTRLETVLQDARAQAAKTKTPLESVQAQLFSLDKQPQIEEQKSRVIAQLNALHQEEPDLGANLLLKQIQQSTFQYREFTSLDYDVVQYKYGTNPLLSGDYQLNIGPRNSSVVFMGAIKQAELTPHRARWFLADYFKSLGELRLDSASPSIAWIIQPDGNVQQAYYGLWNFQPHFIAPGAIVYVPIKSLPSEFESLNQDITELLRHKVKNNE